MAILRTSLLGLSAVCLIHGSAFAQDPKELINQAWRLVMTGKKAQALPVLEKVLSQDPSQEEAYKLWLTIEKDKWHELLLTNGEIGKIAKHILDRATKARLAMSKDADAIAALVTKALDKHYGIRSAAIIELKNKHGEFAIPALLAKLGDHDDDKGSIIAIQVARELGHGATLPLIEALQSKNATLRQSIAAVFNGTRDHRAIASLTSLVKDSNAGVVAIAKAALTTMGAATSADPVALYLKESQDYLVGIGTQGMDLSDVVWSFADGKLSYRECDPGVYTFELAKQSAEKALALDPASDRATTLVARSYLAQCAAIENNKIEDLNGIAAALNMVAVAMGPKTLNAALAESLRDNQPFVAVAAIRALGATVDRDGLAGTALLASLDHGNRMVAFEAALAVTAASRANNVPQAAKVVAVLASGVAMQSLTRVASVGFSAESIKTIQDMSNDKAGVIVEANFRTLHDAVDQIMVGAIAPDAVIVNNTLEDGIPMDIIGILGKNASTKHIKILVPGGAEATYSGKENVKIIDASLKSDTLRTDVLDSVKDVAADPAKVRAARIAAQSSSALQRLAGNRVDISGAVAGISTELSREDAVAIPVANALGEGGNNIDALVAAIGGAGSVELKRACATATGKILGRGANLSAGHFAALKAVAADAKADTGLRTAVAASLGRAALKPAQRLELAKALSIAAVAGK
jgi:hypothetical protein